MEDLERYNFERLRSELEESFARETDLRCKLRLSEQQLELISDELKSTRQNSSYFNAAKPSQRHTTHWNENLNIHMPKTNESFDQIISELKSKVISEKSAHQKRLGNLSQIYAVSIESKKPETLQAEENQENNCKENSLSHENISQSISVDPITGVLLKRKPINVTVGPDTVSIIKPNKMQA